MKNILMALLFLLSVNFVFAQDKSTGDYYDGYTKKIEFDRMIPPHGIEVTFEKTVCAHKGE